MSPEHTDDSTKPVDASRASVDGIFSREMSAAMDLAVQSGDLRSVLAEIAESVRRISQADEVWFVIHSDAVWGESLDFGDDDGPVRVEGDDLVLTRIMDWYGKDFVSDDYKGAEKDLPSFVRKYSSEKVRRWIDAQPTSPSIKFMKYDWKLNNN